VTSFTCFIIGTSRQKLLIARPPWGLGRGNVVFGRTCRWYATNN